MQTYAKLAAFLFLLALGCDNASQPTSDADSGDNAATPTAEPSTDESNPAEVVISLEPADLEKLDSWDATSKASAKLTEMLAEIMAEIKDPESAKAAIPKLDELTPKFAAVSKAEKAFGEPSDDDRRLVLQNLSEANKKFDQYFTPIVENDELNAIVGEAIDRAYLGGE